MSDPALIQALLTGAPQADERRGAPRHGYQVYQRVAFPIASEMPPPSAFEEVQFRDLSTSGCSFWIRSAPSVKRVIVELGKHPHLIYMAGRIVYCTPTVVACRRMFLVGVHFVGRLAL